MKSFYFLFYFISFGTFCFSQNEKQKDSLLVVLNNQKTYVNQIDILNKICLEYGKSSPFKSVFYNQKILALSKKNHYELGYGIYYLNCSNIFAFQEKNQEALAFAKKAAALFNKNDDTEHYLLAIKKISNDYISLSEVEKSKLVLKQNLKKALQYNNFEINVDFYRLLGDCCSFEDSIAKSLFFYKKALPFLSPEKSTSKSHFFQRISDQYTILEQNEKGLAYIDLSIKNTEINYKVLGEAKKGLILNKLGRYKDALSLSLRNYKYIVANKMTSNWQYNLILYNIANAYYYLNEYRLAKPYIDIVIDKKNTISEYKIENYIILSNIYLNEEKIKQARIYSQKALVFHDSLYKSFENLELYSNLSKLEEASGNYKKALSVYRKLINYTNKRNIQINNEKNFLLQTDFDVTLKDYNIKNLQKQQIIKTIENRKQKDLISFIGVLLLISLVSVLFYVKTNKTIKKKNIEIEAEKLLTQKSLIEKETLLKEIHHRVKNNMQMVISLLKIQSIDGKELTIDDFVSVSEARINSMLLIHENLYQNEFLDKICFKEYLNNLKESIISSQKSAKNIQLEVVVNEICLDIQTAIPIGLIINELVNNAYKHAFVNKPNGNIDIGLTEHRGEFTLSVSDDGVGFNSNQKKQDGLGLELVKLLVSQIKGVLQIDNTVGTSYMIQFQNELTQL